MAADPNKTPAEIMRDGILPCGHPAYKEEDKIILDQCFECGWQTPTRREANKLNELAVVRADAETELIHFVRSGEWKEDVVEQARLMGIARKARTAYVAEETQRAVVKATRENENAG